MTFMMTCIPEEWAPKRTTPTGISGLRRIYMSHLLVTTAIIAHANLPPSGKWLCL